MTSAHGNLQSEEALPLCARAKLRRSGPARPRRRAADPRADHDRLPAGRVRDRHPAADQASHESGHHGGGGAPVGPGTESRARGPTLGTHSGLTSSPFHRVHASANSFTFSGCAAAKFVFSPMSFARLYSPAVDRSRSTAGSVSRSGPSLVFTSFQSPLRIAIIPPSRQ